MRVNGINLLAVLAAAVAIYAVGFVIYGLLVSPELWMASQGITQQQLDAVGMGRMVYSPAMPIVTAVGLAVLFKWGKVSGAANGAKWGVLVALASALPTIWYGWVYGVGTATGPLIDSGHLLLGHVVGGSILAKWK